VAARTAGTAAEPRRPGPWDPCGDLPDFFSGRETGDRMPMRAFCGEFAQPSMW